MRALGFFCWFLFLCVNDSQAQILFRARQKPTKSFVPDSGVLHIDFLSFNQKNNLFLSGTILNSRFESQVGGNDSQLQAIFINFDSGIIAADSTFTIVPIGMAKKGIYWGQSIVELDVVYLDVPFVLCILPKDTNKFDLFAQKFMRAPDFDWFDVPRKKDSLHSVFKPMNIDEYLLPLPCSHDPIYMEYVSDSVVNLTIDITSYLNIHTDSCFQLIDHYLADLEQYHGKYCEKKATIVFGHRNVSMSRVTWLFEWFSEKCILLDLRFFEQSEK